ncbi:hypothetical protein [Couchioplanes azureus]|uniref:hypothetical protein n=1 Tax=Couchioplanes caeruleus TaxID=56438 RepID=UPI0016700D7B|nr:hypothetical protein [Couchioplanes caeruleus]
MEFVYWTDDELTEACLEALATGCIEGVPLEADPEDLASQLGFPNRLPPDQADRGEPYGRAFEQRYFAGGLHMTRDWNHVTAFYVRDHLHAPWEANGITIRAYLMDEPPEWSAVVAELRRYGFELVPGPGALAHPDEYTVRASAVSAKVATGDGDDAAPPGRLIDVTINRNVVPLPSPDRRGHIRNAMRALGKAGAGAWPAWLAEREFAADDYAAVFVALTRLDSDQPTRADEWTALLSWFLERARETNAFLQEEWTYHWARYGSPSPAEVSRACMAALPMTLDEALSMPKSWREIAPYDVRRARMTRALLALARDAAPDPAAVREIDRWRQQKRPWIQ